MKRIKWTYKAELDYIMEGPSGDWIVGFLDKEGNPYECPHTSDIALVEKLKRLDDTYPTPRLKVTVEINEKLDSHGEQHPKLLDVAKSHTRID